MYDLIIIGMGIGGITAGIYAKRGNLNVLLIVSFTLTFSFRTILFSKFW